MKIYAVKIKDISEIELNNTMVNIGNDKRVIIGKFINKKDKIRSLVAEILLRTILIEEFGIRNRDIIIGREKYGKPYLQENKEVNFNISHSGEFVVCAVDDDPVGIDIEQILDIDYKAILESFFSKDDTEFILGGNSEKALDRFYEIWTLKESYIKAKGMGLSIPLNSFGFKFYDDSIVLIGNDKEYSFKQFDMFEGYKLAVCSLNKHIVTKVIQVEQDSLIDKYHKLA